MVNGSSRVISARSRASRSATKAGSESFPNPSNVVSCGKAASAFPFEPEEAVLREVLETHGRGVLQTEERTVIVSSTERKAGDLSEREFVADPSSSPRTRCGSTRPEDPTVGDDRMAPDPSDDPFPGFELGFEEALSLSFETFGPSIGLEIQTT